MNISSDIRRMLVTLARDLAALDGVQPGHAYIIGAFSGVSASLRQEFDRAMAIGLDRLDEDGETLPEDVILPDGGDSEAGEADGSSAGEDQEGATSDKNEGGAPEPAKESDGDAEKGQSQSDPDASIADQTASESASEAEEMLTAVSKAKKSASA